MRAESSALRRTSTIRSNPMSDPLSLPYPEVPARADFPAIEQRILDRWATEGTFQASIDQRPIDDEFVFYDGPPFANGLPHHGHLFTGYVKDLVPRYQTMKGRRVERRFGWDCHGLPAEMETEKQLGVTGRAAITEYGIGAFNEQCRSSVMRYAGEWESTVDRQARWVDFEKNYKTMDASYMESVMWAFKQLHDKGLIYEAYRVMPYSWGAETPLSNFEIRMDDATRPRQDPAVTVAFDLHPTENAPDGAKILAWTTTPWTLPSNLALAVGPDIDYAVLQVTDGAEELNGHRVIIGAEAVEHHRTQLGSAEVIDTLPGSALVGRTYAPLLPYFEDRARPGSGAIAFRVLPAEFVDTSEGTGIVHMAPGFGEDDQLICEANGIEIGAAVPVDDQGRFTEPITEWVGVNVFDANPLIIRHLKELGRIVRHDTYEHNYPHCWRTDTPIIYKAISSWYVEVTAIRDRLIELNNDINWVPDHVQQGRFGQWLAGARDWSISRNRFWGSPIPVWKSDNPDFPRLDVYGSLDQIEADFGIRPDDLHRPFIDELTRPNPDDPTGQSTMRRVDEVLDCWFESGSMPFAQVHYPFENAEWFEEHFPADFIVEYINQTRGWFYTLHVLAGALFDRPAFQNVICHGVLLAEDGAKLSKKLRNYTEPSEVFDKQGSDALRWYFMSSNIVRGGDARISDQAIDEVTRQVLLPLWNAYSFFVLYANASGHTARLRTDSANVLDRYILAKTAELVEVTTDRLDAYDLAGGAVAIQGFLDALNNWYIRRSRDRFWGTDTDRAETETAVDTLYTVLHALTRVIAPYLPMIAEEIWLGIASTGSETSSVHLQEWPVAEDLRVDADLAATMDRLRDAASAALSLREDRGLRVRLPLRSATVAGHGAESIRPFVDLLADEINVKEILFSADVTEFGTFRLQPDGRVLGPKLGPDMKTVLAAAKAGEWSANDDGTVTVGGRRLEDGEFTLKLDPMDGVAAAPLPGNDALVVIDTEVTSELEAEGLARDAVRLIQQARKDADLDVTDRIDLSITVGPDAAAALSTHRAFVAGAVLATSVVITDDAQAGEISANDGFTTSVELDGAPMSIRLSKAN
jgi:isoleucyl-tRNA synthetase